MIPYYLIPLISVLASLLWVYASFRYYLHAHSLFHLPDGDQELNRQRIQWSLVSLVLASLAFALSLLYLFSLAGAANPPSSATTLTPGETPGLVTPSRDPLAPPGGALTPPATTQSVGATATPEGISGQGVAVIGNTNTFGANVRVEPGLAFESLTQLSDGSRVELMGEAQSVDGFNWQRVRLEDGRMGWIAENFLIPEP